MHKTVQANGTRFQITSVRPNSHGFKYYVCETKRRTRGLYVDSLSKAFRFMHRKSKAKN